MPGPPTDSVQELNVGNVYREECYQFATRGIVLHVVWPNMAGGCARKTVPFNVLFKQIITQSEVA